MRRFPAAFGGEGLGPENTIEAKARSLAAGADALEIDVRMTGDGVIVARHDRDLAVTTDGSGNVDELPWADVEGLDAAATWHGPGRRGRRSVRAFQSRSCSSTPRRMWSSEGSAQSR